MYIYLYTMYGIKLPLVFATFGFTLNGIFTLPFRVKPKVGKTKGNFIPYFVFCSAYMVLSTLLYFVN